MNYMDLLSRLGVASAHPGGFEATIQLLEKNQPPAASRILEVGCGTGKSACYLASQGFHVTAVDQHPLMLTKAKQRAAKEELTGIEWIEGSAEFLPFENASFDVVFAESVTIFTHIPAALREYHRVLKPGGRLLDREMVLHSKMPEPIYKAIRDYFQIAKIHSVDEWLDYLRMTGFNCDRPVVEPFSSHEQTVNNDEIRELDLSMLLDPEVGQGILKYSELMLAQERYFRVCNFIAYKE